MPSRPPSSSRAGGLARWPRCGSGGAPLRDGSSTVEQAAARDASPRVLREPRDRRLPTVGAAAARGGGDREEPDPRRGGYSSSGGGGAADCRSNIACSTEQRDVATGLAINRRQSTQHRREALLRRRQLRPDELRRELEWLAEQRHRPRGRIECATVVRGAGAPRGTLRYATRNSRGVGGLVAHCTYLAWTAMVARTPSSARTKLSRSSRSARAAHALGPVCAAPGVPPVSAPNGAPIGRRADSPPLRDRRGARHGHYGGVRLDQITTLRYARTGIAGQRTSSDTLHSCRLRPRDAPRLRTGFGRISRGGRWSRRLALGRTRGGGTVIGDSTTTVTILCARAVHVDASSLLPHLGFTDLRCSGTGRSGAQLSWLSCLLRLSTPCSILADCVRPLPSARRRRAVVTAGSGPRYHYPWTILNYAFTARRSCNPDRGDRDSIVAASGQILMDRDHTIDVESDTLYTYATLTPLERPSLTARPIFFLRATKLRRSSHHRLHARAAHDGVSPETLLDAEQVATAVTIDPMRDSTALDQVDAALAGANFYIDIYRMIAARLRAAPPPIIANKIGAARPCPRRNCERIARRVRQCPQAPPSLRTRRERRSNPDDPWEFTKVVFTNGIWNERKAAQAPRGSISAREGDSALQE